MDIRGQERNAKDRELRARLQEEADAADLKWLMGSKRGRRFVWRLLDRAGVFRSSFSQNSMQMSFAEGCRNEGLRTLALVHTHCPELYPVMVKEQATNDHRNADDGSGPSSQ